MLRKKTINKNSNSQNLLSLHENGPGRKVLQNFRGLVISQNLWWTVPTTQQTSGLCEA